MKTRRIYQFGPFRLDSTAKVLLRDGQPVRLARKAVETLLALVENADQVLTKEELLSAVWPDRVVDEANLAQNVAVIRKALGVQRGAAGYIETFPGRGYRILGPISVSEEPGPATLSAEEASTPPAARRWRLAAMILLAAIAILAGLWLRRRLLEPSRPEVPHRVAIARQAGKEYQPAVSPDGSRVAFIWETGELRKAGIWVRDDIERPARRLVGGDDRYSSPVWSPDGRRLAFLRFRGASGAVVVVPADGGPEQVLGSVFPSRYGLVNRHLDWSPDGQWLAVDDTDSPHEAFGIFLISVSTGERKRLTQPENIIIGDVAPRFAPDGRFLSFIRAFHRAHQEVFLVPTQGGTPSQLTSDGKQISDQDWLPDGKTLVFSSDRSGEFRLWKLALGAKATQPTGIYGDFPIQFSLARKAPVLVYSTLQHDLNIWRLDLEAAGAKRWTRVIASPGQDASPQYSPDGRRICFRSDRSGEEQLWVSDAEGGNAVQLTRGSLHPSVGRWSPDGRTIVFNNARSGEIYLAAEQNSGQWQIKQTGATGYHPVFSPDGAWIYAGTMSAIVRFPTKGGPATPVAATKGISLGISPDGTYVYFVREATDSTLWRVQVRSGKLEKVLDGLLPYCSSCWVLAGEGIYYLGARAGWTDRQTLYFHDLASGRDTAVLDYPEPLSPIGSGPFSLSPDQRRLLCVRVDPSDADVFRVEPFR